MYKVYCDGWLLYHSKLENLQIFDPSLELELNKTGSFVFTIYPDHPYYGLIRKLKSIITIYQDDYLIFRGRALDEDVGWNNEKTVTCEGELAFLLDSVQRPYSFTGSIIDGTIVKTVIFEDVTVAENLKTKGQAHLSDSVKAWEAIDLTAATGQAPLLLVVGTAQERTESGAI